jgi:hypothetical protein
MSYDYIKRTYTFQPQVGKHVRHTETNKTGTISREDRGQSHYVMVRFDGQSFALPCHPMALEYVPHALEVADGAANK